MTTKFLKISYHDYALRDLDVMEFVETSLNAAFPNGEFKVEADQAYEKIVYRLTLDAKFGTPIQCLAEFDKVYSAVGLYSSVFIEPKDISENIEPETYVFYITFKQGKYIDFDLSHHPCIDGKWPVLDVNRLVK